VALPFTLKSILRSKEEVRKLKDFTMPCPTRPALLLLKFKTAEARNAVFRARAKLVGMAWGLDEDLTPL
jgi:hypothetical protein